MGKELYNPEYITTAAHVLNSNLLFPGDMSRDQINLHFSDLKSGLSSLNGSTDPQLIQTRASMEQEMKSWLAVLSLPPAKMQKILDSNKFSTTIH